MSRKKKSSAAQDFIEIISLLPWWMAILLAVLAYVYLHSVALVPPPDATGDIAQLGNVASGALKRQLASIGQYLVPFLCLVGAALSAIRRRARLKLHQNALNAAGTRGLETMTWQEFEVLVGEVFRRDGYSVIENGGGGADGGIDLRLSRGNEKFFVQCKQWRALKVGVTVVRELYGVMAAEGVTGGFVVTCGRFTEEARLFAQGRNITLLDGPSLETKMRRETAKRPPVTSTTTDMTAKAEETGSPRCPLCSNAMVERTAKRGANAGNTFWGCASYPVCKGIATRA